MSKKSQLIPWQKPQPERKLPEGLRGIKSLSQLEVAKLVSKIARMTGPEFIASKDDPEISTLEAAVISVFARAISKGDYTGLTVLLDRALGKAPTVIPELNEESAELERLKRLSTKELIEMLQSEPKQVGEKTDV
jgi:hypothetical protein